MWERKTEEDVRAFRRQPHMLNLPPYLLCHILHIYSNADQFGRTMAKGLRSSRKKANNTKLRAKVFGPVENARKERLSAKLLELAARPRDSADSDTKMVEDGMGPITTSSAAS